MEHSKNRRTMTSILVSAVLILAMFTVLGQAVGTHGPTVLVVDADGMADIDQSSQAVCSSTEPVDGTTTFSSIQAAIDVGGVAGGGHFIIVCPGTYSAISVTENEKIYGFPGAKIMGAGGPAVFISGVNAIACSASPDRMIIDGFEITGGTNGITVADSCRVFIQDNDIHDNSVRGILFGRGDHSWIHNNKIHKNGDGVAGEDDGIELGENSNDNFIARNRIFDHAGHGIEIFESFTPRTSIRNLITQNTITNNDGWGVCLCGPVGGSSNTVRGNLAMDNGVSASTGGGYLIKGSSNPIIKNIAKMNVGNGFEVDPAVPGNGGNTLKRNTADNNGGKGFRDLSFGSGTAGTANTYTLNKCINDEENRVGLGAGCTFSP